jgi:hypothetical protein
MPPRLSPGAQEDVTIRDDGHIDGKTRTRTETIGFTGVVRLQFYDANDTMIGESQAHSFRVESVLALMIGDSLGPTAPQTRQAPSTARTPGGRIWTRPCVPVLRDSRFSSTEWICLVVCLV